MELPNLTLIFVGLYACAMIGVGVFAARNQNKDGYIIGNRNLNLFQMAASTGAEFRDAAFVAFWITFSYLYGYAILLVVIPSFIIQLSYIWIGPKVRKLAHERNYIMPGRMIRDFVGPTSQYTAVLFILFLTIAFGAAQLFVLGKIISSATDFSEPFIIITIATIIGFYLWTGGFGSVIKTDIIQFFIILGMVSLPFFLTIETDALLDWKSLGNMPISDLFYLSFPIAVGAYANYGVWQRIFAARDDTAAAYAPSFSGIFFIINTLGLVFIGLAARTIFPADIEPGDILTLLFQLETLSPFLLSFIILVMFAMGMSTYDTNAYAFSSSILRDFTFISARTEQDHYIKYNRIATIAFILLTVTMAVSYESLVNLTLGLISVFNLPSIIYLCAALGLLKKDKFLDVGLSASVWISTATFIYLFAIGAFENSMANTIIPTCVMLALSCGVILVSLLISRLSKKAVS